MSNTHTFHQTLADKLTSATSRLEAAIAAEADATNALDGDPTNPDRLSQAAMAKADAKTAQAMRDDLLELLYHSHQVTAAPPLASTPTTHNTPPAEAHIQHNYPPFRLRAPSPFNPATDDFECFMELATDFIRPQPFAYQQQIMRTLFIPSAYPTCRQAINTATTLQELTTNLQNIFGKITRIDVSVANFVNCCQETNETTQAYAARVRCLALQAYPTIPDLEPYLIDKFLSGLRIPMSDKNSIRISAPKSLTHATALATSLVDYPSEIHMMEIAKPLPPPLPLPPRFCSYHQSRGHNTIECRAFQQPPPPPRPFDPYHAARSGGYRNRYTPQGQRTGHPAPFRAPSLAPICQICGGRGHVATHCRSVRITPIKATPEQGFAPQPRPAINQGNFRQEASNGNNNQ